ncbi:MAG: hemerythrin domain-containing protein [Planctomycetes bacterium]|jgi:hemerythrin-like domain-containing protein|nr:hemerythrin domain-containing protein [Planctomycetota bacterium]
MTPIEMLMHEHRVIEKTIDALAEYAGRLRDGGEAPREDLRLFVTFIRAFADTCHHGKEEDILFTALAARGMAVTGGPLSVMLHEHALGRDYVHALARVAGGAGTMTDAERETVAAAAGGYGELLRAHIQKEDQVLYPMSLRLLPESEWTRIAAAFEKFEAEKTGPGEHERLHELAHVLMAKYPAPAGASSEAAPAGCFGCGGA